jgi:hypothetical protein
MNKTAHAYSNQVWSVPDPLFTELLGAEEYGLSKQGLITWSHYIGGYYMSPTSLEYAFHFSTEENIALYASRHWNCLFDPGNFTKMSPLLRKYNTKGFWYPLTPTLIKTSDGKSFYLPCDPACRKASIDSIKEYLPNLADLTWGVYTADELEYSTLSSTCQLFWNYKKDYPAIMAIDAEIKSKYGSGKYGIPLSDADTNPYRWRALNAWIAEQLVSFQSEVYDTVKSIAPNVLVVSNDPNANIAYPQDRTRWKCDILTNQTYAAQTTDRCRAGWLVKMLVDLSNQKEIWPCMHVENYPTCFTSEEVIEELSQAIRNGATGWHFYPCDVRGNRAGRSFFADEPGAKERWSTIAAVTETARAMKRPIYPKPDFAVVVSTDTYASQPGIMTQTNECEYAYTQLGATPRGWFKFVDDLGISRRQVNLSPYKAVFVPLGKYERLDAAQALVNYARNSGNLISGDPEIFSNSIDANDISSLRTECFGAVLGARRTASYAKYGSTRLPVYTKAFDIKILNGTNVLATYPDGKPAIVSRSYGKGKSIYFAFNPFSPQAISDPSWCTFFKNLEKSLGIKLDQKIWRFQFPMSLAQEMSEPAGRCLTNNYGFWRYNQPLTDRNFDTGGSYTLSVNGDLTADNGTKNSFASGKLTDRLRAWKNGNVIAVDTPAVGTVDDYIVKYGSTKPVSITFDFLKPYSLTSAKLFYAGDLPGVEVYASDDNVRWSKVGSASGKAAQEGETLDITASGNWGKHRFLRLDIRERTSGKELTLSEVEVWAENVETN